MKSQILLLLALSLILVAPPLAWTQTAEDFFHRGAKYYLDGTNYLAARSAVTNGLQLYPNDRKLTNLWELLNRNQQQQQQQQDKDQDKKEEQSKDQQKQDQQKQEQQKQEQQKQDQQKQEQEKKDQQKQQDQQKPEDQQEQQSSKQDKKDGEKKEGQQASESKDKPEDPNDPNAPQQGMVRMTPQQAMRLLDTLKSEEKTMPFRPILKTNRHDRVFKDW